MSGDLRLAREKNYRRRLVDGGSSNDITQRQRPGRVALLGDGQTGGQAPRNAPSNSVAGGTLSAVFIYMVLV